MIPLYLFLLILCVFAIQIRHADRCQKRLHYEQALDLELAEPDQVITLSSTLRNVGRLPIFYIDLMEILPQGIHPEEDEDWCRQNLRRISTGFSTSSHLYLLGRRNYTRSFRFSLPERGRYSFGQYYLTTGDYLGLTTANREAPIKQKIVVMPRRWEDPRTAVTLGGYLGELSVRRFLFEDPVLTIGVREYSGTEPLKQIDWKQTARAGKLQVRKHDYTVDANVTVLLNLAGLPAEQESCYRITRTVCETLERRRVPYEFIGNGDLFGPRGELNWYSEGLGGRHFRTLMYALGQSRGVVYFPFSQLVERCLRRRRRSWGYIVITPPLGEKDQEALRSLRRLSETEPCLLIGRAEEGGEAL